ncbi:MAG: OmpA family protein [Bacteroidota bacterium]
MLARFLLLLFVVTPLALLAPPAEAQSLFERARRAAQRGAERAVEREAERRVDQAVTDAIECALGDEACVSRAEAEGQDVVYVDDEGNPVAADQPGGTPGDAASNDAPAAESLRPGEGAWANYDFVPGDRVLYFDDYEDDYVGNVPRRLDFQSGVMEVVRTADGGQQLRFADASSVALPLPETLPERFTIEFDLYSGDNWNTLTLGSGPLDNPDADYSCFQGGLQNYSSAFFKVGSFFQTGVEGGQGGSSAQQQNAHEQAMMPIRIAVDGSYVKMYVGENRVANVPNADVQRTDRLLLTVCGELAAEDDGARGPILLDNVRVAAGGRTILYDQLQAEGRVALGGLLFDTGSATLRPESTPTLQDLTRTLERNPDLRLRIEGHTDTTGNAEANQRLSQDRADAVKTYLSEQGIDGSRLETQGLGDANPVADNATPEGRQTNRRVEIVKL